MRSMKKDLKKASELMGTIYQNVSSAKSPEEAVETIEKMKPLAYTAQELLEKVEKSLD